MWKWIVVGVILVCWYFIPPIFSAMVSNDVRDFDLTPKQKVVADKAFEF